MSILLLGVRLLLAVVFLAAGIGKLRDRQRFTATLTALDIARPWAAPLATVIPGIELLTGAALLHVDLAPTAAAASLALLAVFTVVATISIKQGTALNCACFGSIVEEPLGLATVVRNAALMALATLVIVVGPGTAVSAATTAWNALTPEIRVLAAVNLVLLIALAATTIHASRLHAATARLTSRVSSLEQPARERSAREPDAGLPAGTVAPLFDLPCLEGDRASLESLLAKGKPVALLFLSAHCPACHELWPDIERWQSSARWPLTVAAVCGGSPQTFELKLMGYTVVNVLLEGDAQVAEAYGISMRPAAVIVGRDGRIAGGSATGAAAVRTLVGAGG